MPSDFPVKAQIGKLRIFPAGSQSHRGGFGFWIQRRERIEAMLLLAYLGGILTILSPCILPGASVCLCALGSAVSQERASLAGWHGAHVCRGGEPGHDRWRLGRPGQSIWPRCSSGPLCHLWSHAAVLFFVGAALAAPGAARQRGATNDNPIQDRTFRIEFLGPGVQAFSFTFG